MGGRVPMGNDVRLMDEDEDMSLAIGARVF